MRITLNLATRPYADQGPMLKRLRIGMGVLALLLIGLGLGLTHFHQRAQAMAAQEDAIDQSIATIQHEQRGYQAQMQQPANAKVLTQAQFLNHLFDEKSFSWTACMEDLERVLPAGVQVTALEPSRGKDGRLTLRLRVAGLRERSVEMVRNMERSRRFVLPRISGENAENGSQGDLQRVQDAGRVSFDVLAEYNPPTLEERSEEIAHQKHAKSSSGVRAVPVPLNPVRPQYVPPNPMQMPRRKPIETPVPEAEAPEVPPGMQEPLRNHDSNRNRPLNSAIPAPGQGSNDSGNGNPGGPQ